MNCLFARLTLIVALGGLLTPVQAVLLPVAEDTSSTTAGRINQTTGKAVTLSVTPKQQAFLAFELSTVPAWVTASNITSARLNLYVSSLAAPGDLTVHVVTNQWQEFTTNVAAPGFSSNVAGIIPAANLAAKCFIEADVTAAVSNWFNGASNCGFAIATATGNVRLGSKEGLGTGFPALLEIETADATLISLPGAVVTNNETGVTLSGSFSGNGSALTSLNPANLSTGTAAINISGNAATATAAAVAGSAATATTAVSFTGPLAGDVTGTQSATVVATSGGHAIVINNETGVTLSGAFSGNGGGLTNVTAATLAISPGMALIPAGAFTMGNSINDSDILEANPISITVSAFYMDVNLVSYAQWQSVYYWATNIGYAFDDAGTGNAPNQPVQTLNWYDCVKWSNARSQQAGLTPVYYTDAGLTQVYTNGDTDSVYVNAAANGYGLPTEAEWEKAARGGLSGQRFPWGNVITKTLANYYGDTSDYSYDLGPNGYNAFGTNVGGSTTPVGYFAANGYGLYDMAGNVFEWCWDWYGTPYGQPTTTNPTGPASGSYRILRGGSWNDPADDARCALRNVNPPSLEGYFFGFRCVRGP